MDNQEIARRLGVTCKSEDFDGFWRDGDWVGGRFNPNGLQFTITLRKEAEDLHKKALQFATLIGDA